MGVVHVRVAHASVRPLRVLALLASAMILAAACSGDDTGPAVEATPTARAASEAASASTQEADPAQTAAPSAPAVPPQPDSGRAEPLSGAPVPPPAAESAAYDRSKFNPDAGAFPALNFPELASAQEAWWLDAETLVLGAARDGDARAYPLFMMRYHHVANDELAGLPYLVTF